MWPHHEEAIRRWAAHVATLPEHLAVVVGGSLVKGWGRPDSDVDGWLVVTDEELARRVDAGDLVYGSAELCDYEGGYVDAKYVNVAFLETVAERGTEAARAAFVGAFVAWSRVDGLDDLVQRAAEYPEEGRDERMATFWAQVQAMQWYVGEAARRDDPYLASWASTRLAMFACRLVLAHNRVLFPYHKWLLRAVDEAAEQPAGFGDAVRVLVREPTPQRAEDVVMALLLFREWPSPGPSWPSRFVHDTEWAWTRGPVPPEDL